MRVWHSSSSESKPCLVCGKKTSTYKVYEQCNITIKIPLCNRDVEDTCYKKIDVKKTTTLMLTLLKKEIQEVK